MVDLIPIENIESRIYLIRGKRIMLDSDLAEFYGVKTFVLNQAVKRNQKRFPEDFMFRLSKLEFENLTPLFAPLDLKSQIVISRWGGRRKMPYAFTEQGVAMLSGLLRSKKAVRINISIMRAFVRLRQILSAHKELARKIMELEQRSNKHDLEIRNVFSAIRKLMEPEEKPRKQIGFRP